ncbi:Sensor-type histidine kinase PrrB [Paraconexibacter sp. AEG42_29]|uniref:histidine kinase n=1 Tax=Paraconexibacter sp. AEG42_29 TaxID=2997339 RepID=A0AAU7ARU8_9ACTN
MRTLRGRLTLGVLTVLAAVLLVGGIAVSREVDRSERQRVDDTLERTANLSLPIAEIALRNGLPGIDDRLDAVLRATGSSLRLSLGAQTLAESGATLPQSLSAPVGFSTQRIRGRNVRLYTATLRDKDLGGLASLVVSSSLRQVENRQERLRRRMLALGAGMLVLAGLGVFFAAGGVLRPLRRLRSATASIAVDEDLEQRVPVSGSSEARSLAGSFNEMLVRLGRSADERNAALAATRRFAADAGHELRTPLTSVQASLSIIARHPQMDPAQRTQLAVDALTEQRRLVHLLDGLQALARGDANPVEHTDVDLLDVVDASLQSARARHPDVTWITDLQAPVDTVTGWEPGLRLLVDNLIGNAARHGRPGGSVRVAVAPAGRGVLVTVEDDGPGIPPADRERIFEPFARAGHTDRPGSGLGLALVAQQARHHGATVTVGTAADLGGARFEVRFGAAPS